MPVEDNARERFLADEDELKIYREINEQFSKNVELRNRWIALFATALVIALHGSRLLTLTFGNVDPENGESILLEPLWVVGKKSNTSNRSYCGVALPTSDL
jgi:hypothetical protein